MRTITSFTGGGWRNDTYQYVETDYQGFDFDKYESAVTEMAQEHPYQVEYGTCHECRGWMPSGVCLNTH